MILLGSFKVQASFSWFVTRVLLVRTFFSQTHVTDLEERFRLRQLIIFINQMQCEFTLNNPNDTLKKM